MKLLLALLLGAVVGLVTALLLRPDATAQAERRELVAAADNYVRNECWEDE